MPTKESMQMSHRESIYCDVIIVINPLTHWGRDEMNNISQTTFSMKMLEFRISLKFVPKGPINNILALVQIMAWCPSGMVPLSEPMMVSLSTHICVPGPQWVKYQSSVYLSSVIGNAECVLRLDDTWQMNGQSLTEFLVLVRFLGDNTSMKLDTWFVTTSPGTSIISSGPSILIQFYYTFNSSEYFQIGHSFVDQGTSIYQWITNWNFYNI